MTDDVVRWRDFGVGCSRCGTLAAYYVPPYWRPGLVVCSMCCRELNRLYDSSEWPEDGRHDI